MPSYKPKVQILLSEEYHKKFKALCEKDRRSDSVMGAIMIEQYINDYEKRNGEIIIDKVEKEDSTLLKAVKLATGVTEGEKLADASIAAGNKAADMFLDAIHKKKESKD